MRRFDTTEVTVKLEGRGERRADMGPDWNGDPDSYWWPRLYVVSGASRLDRRRRLQDGDNCDRGSEQ